MVDGCGCVGGLCVVINAFKTVRCKSVERRRLRNV